MGKFLILAIILAVIASAYLIIDDDGDSDYTLLESIENIEPGLTIEITGNYGGYGYYSDVYTVTDIKDGDVTYIQESHEYFYTDGVEEYYTNEFEPNSKYVCFDYTSGTLPETVTVEKDGKFYKLNGYADSYGVGVDIRIVYEDLVIEYDGKNVLFVDGSLDYTRESIDESGYEQLQADLVTMADVITGTGDMMYKETFTCNFDAFYEAVMAEWDPDDYKGCEITQTKGRYGGVDVDVYTLNGTAGDLTYEDFKICVYSGYIIKAMGYLEFVPLLDYVPMNYTVNIKIVPVPEPETSGYKYLESTDYVKKGMTFDHDIVIGEDQGSYKETTVVDYVDGTKVGYTTSIWCESTLAGFIKFSASDFLPDGPSVNFDYTATTIPDNVSVEKYDDTYVINGELEFETGSTLGKSTFKNLTINFDGSEVLTVIGEFTLEKDSKYADSKYHYDSQITMVTVDHYIGGIGAYYHTFDFTIEQDLFYYAAMDRYYPSEFDGCSIDDTTEPLEDIIADVHIINGVSGDMAYNGYKVYSYQGFYIEEHGQKLYPLETEFVNFDYKSEIYFA